MIVPSEPAVVAKSPEALRQRIVTCHNSPGIAVRAEILRRVETEATRIAETADAFASVFGAVRL